MAQSVNNERELNLNIDAEDIVELIHSPDLEITIDANIKMKQNIFEENADFDPNRKRENYDG